MSSDLTAERGPDGVWRVIADLEQAQDVDLVWHSGPTPIVAVDSEKGGVGKTALVNGLAARAGAAGLKTLVIDLDPRATASHELGAPTNNPDDPDEVTPPFSVNDLLYVDPSDKDPGDPTGIAADAIIPAGEGWPDSVHLLSSERALGNREPDNTTGWENRLRLSLIGVADRYDLVLMDLPPRAGGKLVAAALLAATHALLPTTLDQDGYDGVKQALTTIRKVRRSNGMPALPIIGIVRNIVGRRTNIAAMWDQRLTAEYGDLVLADAAVPGRVLRQESRTARVPYTAGSGRDAILLGRGYTRVLNHIGKAG